jgi:NADP-dependent 3-hydroxy acid dehydrogenase YdfG
VTGASSGIGAATARRLAADGWSVVAAARRLDRLGELAAADPRDPPAGLDVTDPRSVEALVDALPSCDLLVANAGGAYDLSPIADGDAEVWARTYDVNVLGVLRTVQALLPALEAARGHVVITGSTARRWVYEGGASYVGAKHALSALRETLRLEVVERGVRVSEVAPGMVPDRGVLGAALRRGRGACGRGLRRGRTPSPPRTSPRRSSGGRPAGARQHRPGADDAAAAGRGRQGRPPPS